MYTDIRDYSLALYKIAPIVNKLTEIIKSTGKYPEGNIFTEDKSFIYSTRLFTKQVNVFRAAKNAKNIIEIGFNAGHSSLLMLLANSESKLTIFDINWHTYTKPCFEYLDSLFPGRMTFIEGDSVNTVPEFKSYEKYDLVHIDGAHDHIHFISDIFNIKRFINQNSIVMLDDVNENGTVHPLDIITGVFSEEGIIDIQTDYRPTELYAHVIVKFTDKFFYTLQNNTAQ